MPQPAARDTVCEQRSERNAPALLQECAAVSRRLGGDSYLTLHGGGNTSVKVENTIFIKGSGFNLATITAEGFSALRRVDLDRMLAEDLLSDVEMVDGFRAALLDEAMPSPSIEALLHNLLPFKAVLHTHADAVVSLTNTVHGLDLPRKLFGNRVLYLPYCKPGFELAKRVRDLWSAEATPETEGIVLAHHGLFTFADDIEHAYNSHLNLVHLAAGYIQERTGVRFQDDVEETYCSSADEDPLQEELEAIAAECSAAAGTPTLALAVSSPAIRRFVARADLLQITQRGPATLEHVIHTKRVPLLASGVSGISAYVNAYLEYFNRLSAGVTGRRLAMLSPEPRVILHPRLGLVATGRSAERAQIAQDIYRHTMRVIEAAEALGGYRTISEADAFDIEYWELEQRKLR